MTTPFDAIGEINNLNYIVVLFPAEHMLRTTLLLTVSPAKQWGALKTTVGALKRNWGFGLAMCEGVHATQS